MQHDFQDKLILYPGKSAQWVDFPASDVPKLFGPKEIEAMPLPGRYVKQQHRTCSDGSMLGSYVSLASHVLLPVFLLCGRPAHCDNTSIPEHCCVGSTSLLGYTTWFETACKHANFLQMPYNATGELCAPPEQFFRQCRNGWYTKRCSRTDP